jgi:hypothetical protein
MFMDTHRVCCYDESRYSASDCRGVDMTRLRIAASFLTVILFAATAGAEEAADVFNQLYGDAYRQALGSREADDDLAVAEQIMTGVDQLNDRPVVQAYLLEKVYELTSRTDEGFDDAMNALDSLQGLQPDKLAEHEDRKLQLYMQYYRRAPREDRMIRATEFANAAIEVGEARELREDYAGAQQAYGQGLAIAKGLRLDEASDVELRSRRAAGRAVAQRKVESFSRRMKATPNPAIAKQIAKIYLLELDKPEAAAPYAEKAEDEKLARMTALAAKPLDELGADEALKLGLWYESMADEAPAETKLAVLTRAVDAMEHFLAENDGESIEKVQANVKLEALNKQIAAMSPDAAGGSEDSGDFQRRRTYELVKMVDVKRDAVQAAWIGNEKAIANANGGSEYSEIAFPVKVNGSYKMNVTFSFSDPGNSYWYGHVYLLLPVGNGNKTYYRASIGSYYNGPELGVVGAQPRHIATAYKINKDQNFTASVLNRDGKVKIQIAVNGKVVCTWAGHETELRSKPDVWGARDAGSKEQPGWGVYSLSTTIKSAKIRLIDGTMEKVDKSE